MGGLPALAESGTGKLSLAPVFDPRDQRSRLGGRGRGFVGHAFARHISLSQFDDGHVFGVQG